MKRNLILTVASIAFSAFVLHAAAVAPLLASTGDQVIGGFTNTGKAVGYAIGEDGAPKKEFAEAMGAYATGFAGIMSAFFIILTIYGGWLWMSAQGNEEKITMGKMRILSGLIGLAIIIAGRLVAELVIYYVGQATVGASTTPAS